MAKRNNSLYADKKSQKQIKRLAEKVLKTYRLYRKMGYNVAASRANAHFSIVVMSSGRKNLFAENILRRYPGRR